jgi:hypothetical protein
LHYSPKPIDTPDVLTNELNGIVELLPKNTPENWASIRMSQGWRYGSERNNEYKEPCLVPFEKLPKSEKEYDRKIVREMLMTLFTPGFEIQRTEKTE